MKKINSLKSPTEFNKVLNEGKKIRTLSLLISYKEDGQDSKIGISVPKSLGNAVLRNKTKRQIKNILTNNWNFGKKVKFVLIVKKPFLKMNFKQQTIEIINTIEKIKNVKHK